MTFIHVLTVTEWNNKSSIQSWLDDAVTKPNTRWLDQVGADREMDLRLTAGFWGHRGGKWFQDLLEERGRDSLWMNSRGGKKSKPDHNEGDGREPEKHTAAAISLFLTPPQEILRKNYCIFFDITYLVMMAPACIWKALWPCNRSLPTGIKLWLLLCLA